MTTINFEENDYFELLTRCVSPGSMSTTPMPTSLPQAAPVARDGMKTPLETLSPYVHTLRKNNTIVNTTKLTGL